MTTETQAGEPQDAGTYSRDKIILLLGLITYGLGQTLLFVIWPPLISMMDQSREEFGIIMAASNLVLALSAPFWGKASDKWGRKNIIMLGMGGYCIGTILVALGLEGGVSGTLVAWPLFLVLLVARLIYGGLASAIQPAASAYIADTTPPSKRAQGLALLGVSAGIGTVIGPTLGASPAMLNAIFPGLNLSPISPMYLAIFFSLCGIALIHFYLPEPPARPSTDDQKKVDVKPWDPRVWPYLTMWFFFFMFFTMLQLITVFYIEDFIGITGLNNIQLQASLTLISMAVCVIIMQAFVLQIYNVRAKILLRLACPVFATGMTILIFASSMWPVYFAYVLFGVAFSFATPGITGSSSLSVNADEQGTVAGYLASASILGMVIGPLAGPFLFEAFSPTFPIMVAAIGLVCLSVFAFFVNAPDPEAKS